MATSDPIGICHDIPINIGGIEGKLHFFIIKYSNADLILE